MITQTKIFETMIIGDPKGQPRPRAFARAGKTGAVKASVYDPGTAEGWKGSVVLAVKELEGRGLTSPLMVSLVFFIARPKMHFGKNGLKPSAPRSMYSKKPDADNLAKAVLDALTIIHVWQDDDQVTDLIVRKRWAFPHAPGCRIQIYELTERTS